jgi:hypothetical protein
MTGSLKELFFNHLGGKHEDHLMSRLFCRGELWLLFRRFSTGGNIMYWSCSNLASYTLFTWQGAQNSMGMGSGLDTDIRPRYLCT